MFKVFITLFFIFFSAAGLTGCGGFSGVDTVSPPPVVTPNLPPSELRENSLVIATEEPINNGNSGYILNKVYYSNDLGQSWVELPRVQNLHHTSYINMLKFNNSRLLIGTSYGLSVTDDFGSTWRFFENLNSSFSTVFGKTYDAVGSEPRWYAATINGIIISNNNGATWSQVRPAQLGQSTSNTVTHILPSGPRLFATTLFGVLVSNDQGQTWQAVNYASNPGFVNQGNPSIKANSSDLWISDSVSGLFLSSNNGQTWQPIVLPDVLPFREFVQGLEFGQSNVMAWNYLGYFASANNGQTWSWRSISSITGQTNARLLDLSISGQTGLALTNNPSGLYLTQDQGLTWVNVTNNLDFPAERLRKVFAPKN